ncbi:hypothetical protein X741_02870 [Mesorhizobium sp. LNHC229A00]|nr:hypothetical protein X741_02870 [Mesorhizobium sp. LNHC229A00]
MNGQGGLLVANDVRKVLFDGVHASSALIGGTHDCLPNGPMPEISGATRAPYAFWRQIAPSDHIDGVTTILACGRTADL